ncbi:hypothetical protein BC835DRAFT_1416979 [Cytidiella melzeri]|nr:hypothetical protein BC835DRAFT_1416979 [Cytidiella melzeri]
MSAMHTSYPLAGYPRSQPVAFDHYLSYNGYHGTHPVTHYSYVDVDLDSALRRASRECALAQRRVQVLQQQQQIWQAQLRVVEEQRREQRRKAEAEALVRLTLERIAIARQRHREQLHEEYVRAIAEQSLRHRQEVVRGAREDAQQAIFSAFRSHEENKSPVQVERDMTALESLHGRLATDNDPEVREVIQGLLNLISNGASASQQNLSEVPTCKQDKGKARETPVIPFPWEKHSGHERELKQSVRVVHFDTSAASPPPAASSKSESDAPGAAGLYRKPAIRVPIRNSQAKQQSLGAIDRVSGLLQELKGSFVFPTELDHASSRSPSPVPSAYDGHDDHLPFTSRNKPVHLYQHALSGLLAKLDEVESHGDEEVRRKRKEVVLQVEQALEEVDRKVAEGSPKAEKIELEPTAPVLPPSGVKEAERATFVEHITLPSVKTASEDASTDEDSSNAVSAATYIDTSQSAATDSISPLPLAAEINEKQAIIAQDTHIIDHTIPELNSKPTQVGADIVTPSTDTVPDAGKTPSSETHMPTEEGSDNLAAATEEPVVVIDSQSLETDAKAEHDEPADDNDALSTPGGDETFLLRGLTLGDDKSYTRAKARVAANKEAGETDWEEADLSVSDGEAWSEVE